MTELPAVQASTSAKLRAVQEAHAATQAALAASQADLTSTRGLVVDLSYTLDAFQIESGADRNASYGTGIAAVRKLAADLTRALQDLAEMREQRDEAWRDLARAAAEIDRLRALVPAPPAQGDPS